MILEILEILDDWGGLVLSRRKFLVANNRSAASSDRVGSRDKTLGTRHKKQGKRQKEVCTVLERFAPEDA